MYKTYFIYHFCYSVAFSIFSIQKYYMSKTLLFLLTALLPTPGTSSAIPATEPSAPKMQVDIESLLEKLVAAGIINTKMYEEAEPEPEPEPESTDTNVKIDTDKESEEISSEIEKIELTTESLRM